MIKTLPWLAPACAIGIAATLVELPVPDWIWALPLSVSIIVYIVRFGSHSGRRAGHGGNRRK